jgi:hypothetical protein
MTDSVFDNVPTVDPDKDYLTELVGEGKKFQSERELARAKVESDAFIQRLQGELKGLREDLVKRASIEDFLDQMKSMNESPPAGQPRSNPDVVDEPKGSGPSPEDLEKLIEQHVSKRESQRTAQENLSLVKAEMQKAWGEDYSHKLAAKAKELGVGEEFLNQLAREKPKAFLKLVDAQAQPQRPDLFNPRSTSVDASKLATLNAGNNEQNYSYFDKLRRENPKEYWNPRTQNAMFKLAKENPDKFFDR